LELFGASRICERRGDAARARSLYRRSIDKRLPPATDRGARISLARLAKRAGDFALACELWQDLLGNSNEGLEAYEQLAIHLERRERNLQKAATLSQQAMLELRRAEKIGILSEKVCTTMRSRFEKRAARLAFKLNRTQSSLISVPPPACMEPHAK
jgi:tetratricopeptide (TPR) repeat protein